MTRILRRPAASRLHRGRERAVSLAMLIGVTSAACGGSADSTRSASAVTGATSAAAQPATERVDPNLQAAIEARVADFRGTVGVYVRHQESGQSASLNRDSLFPTASLIKVPILLGVFDRIERGQLDYHQKLVYRDSLLYPGEDILGSFRDGAEIELAKLVMLMITTSDNTASLWLQSLAGSGIAINQWLAGHGFEHTRVNSRTPGREAERERLGWGQTTPGEMARLLTMIREGRAVSPAASDEMYRALTRIYWNDEALSEIPPSVQVASKQGAVDRSRSEVLLVNAPHGDYVLSVITKDQEDTSWESDNEGFELLRDLSRMVWQHFEPDHAWTSLPFPPVTER